jgi:hypothetical protein
MTNLSSEEMYRKAKALTSVCRAIQAGSTADAVAILKRDYGWNPFKEPMKRSSNIDKKMRIFRRDGFIDRYSGNRLVFPGTLRLLSLLMKDDFPYHPHWKTSVCHPA